MHLFKICVPCATFLLLCVLSACQSSMVYSPSINLPAAPLAKNQGQLEAGLDVLAETRPHTVDRKTTLGGQGLIRYGFSDVVSLHLKGWSAGEGPNSSVIRSGYSGGALLKLNDTLATWRLALAPTGFVLFDGGSIEGGGAAFTLTAWSPSVGILKPFAAIGPAVGVRDPDENQWGYGLVANLGGSLMIVDNLSAHVEVAGIIQRNVYDDITHGIIAPSAGLSWYFDVD